MFLLTFAIFKRSVEMNIFVENTVSIVLGENEIKTFHNFKKNKFRIMFGILSINIK